MNTPDRLRAFEFYRSLPKVDLHRHIEGSIRLKTLLEVRREHAMPLPGTGELDKFVQIDLSDQYTAQNFLAKFQILRQFYKSHEVITRITRETIADAADDNVRYLELRFTPAALSRAENFSLGEVMDWVIDAARAAEEAYGVKTRLIASLNRHESAALAERVIQLSCDRKDQGLVGVDLAGDEAHFPGLEMASLFREARQTGLHVTVHAGEWGEAKNIADAINLFRADRIGHGVRVLEDPQVVALARERGIPFEICLTSNFQSGVVAVPGQHPLPAMLASGLNATINTDDPSISRITLSDEYLLACEVLNLSLERLRERILAAAQASFLPENEKEILVTEIENELISYP